MVVTNVLVLVVFVCVSNSLGLDLTKEPGHMKKFGEGRQIRPIDQMEGFPDARHFFREYVSVLKPLKMTGAAKLSKAFELWNDEYFLNLKELDKEEVLIETRKKENRSQPTSFMTLREFVKIYNSTDQYMVNNVPQALRPDMIVPCPVQCDQVIDNALVEALMWFSSGGTKSVVHTDAVENINCLLRGDKELVMVDPLLFGNKVDLDHPEGSYSDIDVDAVDYTKYPDLAEVEFFHVNLTAGDCLYIPYRWIHQVRSYGSNLAVNIWWDHYKSADVNPNECSHTCDYSLTLDKVKFAGFSASLNSEQSLKDHISTMLGVRDKVSEDRFVSLFLGDDMPDEEIAGQGFKDLLRKIFRLLDQNKDGNISKEELEAIDSEIWQKARDLMLQLEVLLSEIEKDFLEQQQEEMDEGEEPYFVTDEEVKDEEVKDEL